MHITLNISSLTLNIGDSTMAATLQQVLDTVTALQSSLVGIRQDIQALKDQVASGSPVTQAQLDDLLSTLQNVAADASELDSET